MPISPRYRQRGFTLVESLIAFLVLSLGMLAVVRLQPELRQHAELARQRSEATRLAQLDIEGLRGFLQLRVDGAAPAFEGIASADYAIEPDALGSPRYAVQRSVDAASWPNARSRRRHRALARPSRRASAGDAHDADRRQRAGAGRRAGAAALILQNGRLRPCRR